MKRSFKKSIAVLLAVLMVVCTIPMSVFAANRANVDVQFGVFSAGTDRQTYTGTSRNKFDPTKTGLTAAKLDYNKATGALTDSTNGHAYAVGDYFTASVVLENVSSLASAQIGVKYSENIAPATVVSNAAALATATSASQTGFPAFEAIPAQSGDGLYNTNKTDAAVGEFSYIDAENRIMWANFAVQTGDNFADTSSTTVGVNNFQNTAVIATFAFKIVSEGAITFSLANEDDVYSAYYLPQLTDDNSPSQYYTYAKTEDNGSAALDFMGANKNVEATKYTITFVGADGNVISSTQYNEGATVTIPELPAAAKIDDDNHNVYAWDTTPAQTATANATYTVVATAEAHKWDAGVKQEDGSTLYTCDVCGATKTEAEAHVHKYTWTYNNDATWTSSTVNSDGTATGVCECGDTITKTISGTGTLRANSASVTLGAAVVLNIGINKDRSNKFDKVEFEVEFGGQKYTVSDINDAKTTATRIYYDFDRVSPEKFGDSISITPIGTTTDGIVCKGHTINYSIKQYCYNTLKSSNAKLSKLLVELLYYGAEYQNYRNYNTSELVTADLTSAQKALHTTDVPEYVSMTAPNYETNPNGEAANKIRYRSANLLLEGKIIPQVRFEIAKTENINDYVFCWTVNGVETKFTYAEHPDWFIPTSASSADNNCYYVQCTILQANQLSIPFYLTVFDSTGKQVSNKLRYSVESYATSSTVKNNAKLKALVDQILRYGRADVDYMGGTATL